MSGTETEAKTPQNADLDYAACGASIGDKNLEALTKLLSPNPWVAYAKYISFNNPWRKNVPETDPIEKAQSYAKLKSICEEHKADIDTETPYPNLEQQIKQQAGATWSQISELISNAVDACAAGAEIGRFGIGFKQVLQELYKGARVLVITKEKAPKSEQLKEEKVPEHGRLLEFAVQDDIVYQRDQQIAASHAVAEGTRIVVTRKLNPEDQQAIIAYIKKKYSCCLHAKIFCNKEQVNDLSDVVDASPDAKAQKEAKSPAKGVVTIRVHSKGYEVTDADYGKGMSDIVFYEHFLMPRQSTKTNTPGGEHLYYTESGTTGLVNTCVVKLVVCNVMIEEFPVESAKELGLPAVVILHLPHMTKLSAARNQVILDDTVFAGLRRILKAIVAQAKPNDFKLQVINYLITVLKSLSNGVRATGQEQDDIETLKSEIRAEIAHLLDPDRVYLPRIPECDYFDLNIGDYGLLDQSIYPEAIIARVPGILLIKTFESNRYDAAWTLPFKHGAPSFIDFGNVLIVDRAIYELYQHTPEALNLMLNHWIGYGDKKPPRGVFRKEEAKDHFVGGPTVTIIENDNFAEEAKHKEPPKEMPREQESKTKEQESKKEIDPEKLQGMEKKAEKLAKEIIPDYKLIEEEILKNAGLGFDGGFFWDGSFGGGLSEPQEQKRIERLVKNSILISLKAGKEPAIITAAIRGFLERYDLLGVWIGVS